MPGKSERPRVPKFANEAEEAKWWHDNQEMVEEELLKAMKDGTVQHGTAQRLAKEARELKSVTLRLPPADIERARRLAGEKGIEYETYMKMLLQEALRREDAPKPNQP